MDNQESTLSKSIYENMQLKDTDELLKIWVKNDGSDWSDEAFSVIHNILLERLGIVPEQKTGGSRRRHSEKIKGKNKIPTAYMILSPGLAVLLLLLLIPVIKPRPDDEWFSALFLISIALSLLVPGIYLGWESIFKGEQIKKKVAENIPGMKKMGIFYRFETYFLPDRFVPTYFLFRKRFMSIVLILGGIGMIIFLIGVL